MIGVYGNTITKPDEVVLIELMQVPCKCEIALVQSDVKDFAAILLAPFGYWPVQFSSVEGARIYAESNYTELPIRVVEISHDSRIMDQDTAFKIILGQTKQNCPNK